MTLAIVGTPVRGDFGTFESPTKTLSVTVPSGAELLVLKVMGGNGGSNWGQLTGVTVNGSSTGVALQVTSQADMSIKSRIWTLVNPTVGTYDVVWTFSGSSENGGAYFAECLGGGVDTENPVADTDSFGQSSAASPMTNSLTVPAGGAVTGVHGLNSGTLALESGQTAIGTLDSRGSSYKVADGTVTFGHNWTGTPQAAQSVIAIRAVAAAPIITGPSGAAGAASSTANLAEVATTGPTFTTSVALGGGYPTLTGADAASFAITALSSTSWRVDPVTPFNFESLPHSNPFNVTFNASASVSQTCAITITNVNEAPGFSGTISVPGLTESVAMSAINAALLFSDPDSGDTGTYSAVGTFPTGVTVSSGGLISGTPGAGTAATYSSLRVRRTDAGGLTADSNLFPITVAAAGTAPSISVQPASQTVTEGAIATFSVTASGSGSLAYQWRFNGSNVGANSSSYARTTVLGDNGGIVSVVITGDTAPPATSSNATLTVNAASGLAGFDFHSTAGCRFGAIAGSLVALAPEVGVSIVIRVNDASTGDRLVTLPAAVTNSSGYLPRATHASLVAATSYTLNAVWPDGAVYAFNMVAT